MKDTFFPFIGVPSDYVSNIQIELPLLHEYAYDFKNNDFIIDPETNDLMVLTGAKALEVWIYKAILTDRFEYPIYSWDYGTELTDLVGQKFSKGLTEAEAFRYIKEALMINPYINDVDNLGVEFNGDTVNIKTSVDSVYGEVKIDVRR